MKNIFTTLALAGITLASQAQNNSQAFDWATNTGAGMNGIRAVRYDSHGNALGLFQMCDTASFFGNVITQPMSGTTPINKYYIGKRNTNGTAEVLLNSNPSGPYTFAEFRNFVLDANDNIIVCGSTSAGTTPTPFGNNVSVTGKGYFFVKYNSAGVAQWAKLYDFGSDMTAFPTSTPFSMRALADGSIIAYITKPYDQFALVKIDANGNEVWYKEYSEESSPAALPATGSNAGFFCDETGRSYLTIPSNTSADIKLNGTTYTSGGTGVVHAFIMAFDANGNNIFVKGFCGQIGDFAVEPQTGNLIIYWGKALPTNPNNPAPFDVFNALPAYGGVVILDSTCTTMLKYSSSTIGSTVAVNTLYPLGNSKLIATKKFQKGGTYTAGTQSFSLPNTSAFMWTELDSTLTPKYFVAEPELNQNSSEAAPVLAVHNNKVLVGAAWNRTTNATITVNGKVLTANGYNTSFDSRNGALPFGMDILFAQFDRTLQGDTAQPPVGVKETSGVDFNIYPNPAHNSVNVQFAEAHTNGSVAVYNMIGEKIVELPATEKTLQIDLQNLQAGIYFLSVTQGEKRTTQKLIVR